MPERTGIVPLTVQLRPVQGLPVSRVPALRSLWLADLVSVIEKGRAGAEKQPSRLGAFLVGLAGEEGAGAIRGEVVSRSS
jgi:hypothetical protein